MKFDKEFWFNNWPRVGIVVAVFLLILLFFNTYEPIGSIQWLYWFCLPLYMIHQFEEYVWPGGFQKEINRIISKEESVEILTSKDTFFINILFIWVLTPVLIIFAHFSVIFPIIMVTIVGVNGLTHIFAAIRFQKYNPGLIMSILFNIPLSIYILTVIYRDYMSTVSEYLIGIAIGVVFHAGLFIFIFIKSRRKSKS